MLVTLDVDLSELEKTTKAYNDAIERLNVKFVSTEDRSGCGFICANHEDQKEFDAIQHEYELEMVKARMKINKAVYRYCFEHGIFA